VIVVIAIIARNRKGKNLPRIDADERGSGKRIFTTEARRHGEKQTKALKHRGTEEAEEKIFYRS
jgi:hypothetical protein